MDRFTKAILPAFFLVIVAVLGVVGNAYIELPDVLMITPSKGLPSELAETKVDLNYYKLLQDMTEQELKEYKQGLSELERQVLLDNLQKQHIVSVYNQFLSGKMANMGEVVYQASRSQTPSVSGSLMIAIMKHETLKNGKFFNSYNVRVNNNVSGMNWTSDSRYRKNGWYVQYDTIEQSIWDMAERLSKHYIADGLVTIEQIGHRYAPLTDNRNGMHGMENGTWIPKVSEYYNKIIKAMEVQA